jgi:hypothetical protein
METGRRVIKTNGFLGLGKTKYIFQLRIHDYDIGETVQTPWGVMNEGAYSCEKWYSVGQVSEKKYLEYKYKGIVPIKDDLIDVYRTNTDLDYEYWTQRSRFKAYTERVDKLINSK